MKDWGFYEWISYVLVLIGGINWGLLGLFRMDLFATIFGIGFLNRIFCILIGVAAGYLIYKFYVSKKETVTTINDKTPPSETPPPPNV